MSDLIDDIGFMGLGDEEPIEAEIVGDLGYDGAPFVSEERPQESKDSRKEEARPDHKAVVKRESAADMLTLMWGGAGAYLVKSRVDVPVGRIMQFQAGLAGNQLDTLFANTVVDKLLLQPLAKAGDKAEGLGAILAGPILIGIYERNPEVGPLLEGLIRAAIETTIVESEPLIRKKNARNRRAAEAMASMASDMGIPKDVDPIDAILHMVFAPVDHQPTNATPVGDERDDDES